MAQQQYPQPGAHPQYQQAPGQPQYQQQAPQQQYHQGEKQQTPNATAYANAHGAHGKWSFGLFDCFSPFGTCCLSCWCPCMLYQKNHDRERGVTDSSGCGGQCLAWYCLACIGGSCILQCINRTSMREKYGIEGGSCGDFCASCCCGCCTLIQESKEITVRTTGMNPKTEQPYSSPNQMTYP